MGTLFGRQIVLFNAQKKRTRRTRKALRSIISNFKYRYQSENTKKKFRVIGTLNSRVSSPSPLIINVIQSEE